MYQKSCKQGGMLQSCVIYTQTCDLNRVQTMILSIFEVFSIIVPEKCNTSTSILDIPICLPAIPSRLTHMHTRGCISSSRCSKRKGPFALSMDQLFSPPYLTAESYSQAKIRPIGIDLVNCRATQTFHSGQLVLITYRMPVVGLGASQLRTCTAATLVAC